MKVAVFAPALSLPSTPVLSQLTKYRDLKISTLGMTPTKFTKSGAPAVSMDVLNDLAGDPYAVSSAVLLCNGDDDDVVRRTRMQSVVWC